jgi:hypothetical protein
MSNRTAAARRELARRGGVRDCIDFSRRMAKYTTDSGSSFRAELEKKEARQSARPL